jgi:hypothetical protein
MKITGFSFIKDALVYDYPVVEAIRSILPICDEVVVAVGKSNDKTYDLISGIDKEKIRIVETIWDESLREGGKVLAEETNKAFRAIGDDADWAFYIQGDEVIHEKYLDEVYRNMVKYQDDRRVDGLLFKYLHFYGSYDYVGSSSRWYQHEIRVVKNDKSIYSFRDAQGFRKGNNQMLRVKPIEAYMYHYGWVKEPGAMQKKQENFSKYWHSDDWINKNVKAANEFDYSEIDSLKLFDGTHPEVMMGRIAAKNWKFDYDLSYNKIPPKEVAKRFFKRYLGLDFSYKNYRIV